MPLGQTVCPLAETTKRLLGSCLFFNVGQHIQSEKDNFLICGANCSENHVCMQQYVRKLVQDIAYLESHPVSINGFSCKFMVELVPADMKWLSAMARELNNVACFFSPFGDVNTDNMNTPNGSPGEEATCTWHPWRYEKRVEMAKKVAAKKEQLSGSGNSSKTQRNKLLNFMKAQGSRQEHEPVLGKLIDHGFAEPPLHNSNNAWAFLHYLMLAVALSKSNFTQSCNDIDQLPEKSTFVVYLTVLKDVLRVSRLVRKVKSWFAEGRKCPFSYRFTGKETKVFCRKFMFVLQALSDPVDSTVTQLKLASIAFCCVQLRDAVSYFSRVNITQAEVEKCKLACLHFFNACVLFKSVTPTLWTVGYAIPRHLQILFDRYGMGLGLNSMQGREAKHVRLFQFAKHSTKSTRWSMVLRHDYISNVWVCEHEPACLLYTKYKAHYIPNEAELETFCYCGFPAKEDIDSCSICSSIVFIKLFKKQQQLVV